MVESKVLMSESEKKALDESQAIAAQRDAAYRERDIAYVERDKILAERNELIRERDRLLGANNDLMSDRDKLIHQRNISFQERDLLMVQRDQAVLDVGEIASVRDSLIKSNHELAFYREKTISENEELKLLTDKLNGFVRNKCFLSSHYLNLKYGPVSVVVEGIGPHAAQIRGLLAEVAVPVSREMNVSPPRNTIVVGVASKEDQSFEIFKKDSCWSFGGKEGVGFSPLVIADLVPLSFKGHVIAAGFPGSGNGVVQAILENFFSTKPSVPPENQSKDILSAYAAAFSGAVCETINEMVSSVGGEEVGYATDAGVDITASWRFGKHYCSIFGIPVRNYLFERLHKTHEKFGPKMHQMCAGGSRCLLVVRNPLDTIVSIAKKQAKFISIFRDEWLFRELVKGVVDYYKSWLSGIAEFPTIKVIRYEDCERSFDSVYQEIVEYLGEKVGLSEQLPKASQFWGVGLAHPGHLWRPGSGKWKEYFSRRNLNICIEEGLDDVMRKLEYEFPEVNCVGRSAYSRFKRPNYHPSLAIPFFAHCFGSVDEVVELFSRSYGCGFYNKVGRLTLMSDSRDHLSKILSSEQIQRLQDLVSVGSEPLAQQRSKNRSLSPKAGGFWMPSRVWLRRLMCR